MERLFQDLPDINAALDMSLFKKKVDPLDDRARALNAEIAAVEATIKKLQQNPLPERLRSSVTPPGKELPAAKPEPIFERVNQKRIRSVGDPPRSRSAKELAGKNAFPGLWARLKKHFQSPSSDNPRLVNYLAAGSIQGLRPLRYEKRVARNRFLLLFSLLVLIVLGSCYFFLRDR